MHESYRPVTGIVSKKQSFQNKAARKARQALLVHNRSSRTHGCVWSGWQGVQSRVIFQGIRTVFAHDRLGLVRTDIVPFLFWRHSVLSSTTTASTHGGRNSTILVRPESRRTRGNYNSAAFHILPVVAVTNSQSQRPLALTFLLGGTTNSHRGSTRFGLANITIPVTATSRANRSIRTAISLFRVLPPRFRVVIPRLVFLRCRVKRYRGRGTRRGPISV